VTDFDVGDFFLRRPFFPYLCWCSNGICFLPRKASVFLVFLLCLPCSPNSLFCSHLINALRPLDSLESLHLFVCDAFRDSTTLFIPPYIFPLPLPRRFRSDFYWQQLSFLFRPRPLGFDFSLFLRHSLPLAGLASCLLPLLLSRRRKTSCPCGGYF